MTNYKRLKAKTDRQIVELSEYYDIEYKLVENILCYAQCLQKRDIPGIDGLIFKAQMLQRFSMTNGTLLDFMYEANKVSRKGLMTLEEFCAVICTFVTRNIELKIPYVFKVYDVNSDGTLSTQELYALLKPCVDVGVDSEEAEESVKELIDLVIKITDLNNDSNIDQDEFARLVRGDILYLQLLGPCLPPEKELERFIELLTHVTPFQTRTMFANERCRSLYELPPPQETTLYPIILDM